MQEFKVGDKAVHRMFGEVVIRFGPYRGLFINHAYLIESTDGTHYHVGEGLSPIPPADPRIDAIAKAICESDGSTWHMEPDYDQEQYRENARAALAVIDADRPLKVGDKVRVVKDDPNYRAGEFVGKVGTLREVDGSVPHSFYRVEIYADQDVPYGDWWCAEVTHA